MIISHRFKFIFISIPKTGSTSTEKTIIPFLSSCDFSSWNNTRHRLDLNTHSPARIVIKDNIKNYFKFAFVRNPWDRQVSLFSNLCQLKPSLIYPEGKHLDVSFREWIKSDAIKINTRLPMRISGLYKKLPQLHWLVDDNRKIIVDFVGKFENFQHDFLYVVDKIGIRSDILHENKTVHDHYLSYYDEESIDIVYKWMKDDCDTFGYEKPKLSENS